MKILENANTFRKELKNFYRIYAKTILELFLE